MKALLLTIGLIGVAFSTSAQTPDYFGNNPNWYFEASHSGVGDGSDSYTETAVMSLYLDADYAGYYTAYKRYIRYYFDLSFSMEAGYAARYVRQEGRAIYFYNEETEADELFISYDLEVGDTVKGEFANINGIVIVQSIDSVMVGADYRHIFYTDPEPSDFENKHLIEGIGYLLNEVEAIGDFFGGDHYAGEAIGSEFFLNCYGENIIPLWSSTDDATCGFSLGVQEKLTKNSKFSAFPNPFRDKTAVISEIKIISIRVHTIHGVQVFEMSCNSNEAILDLNSLQSGTYILTIELEDATVERKKMMKQ